ncbi:MAG: sigma-54 dependent transcriptional regulator [Tannerella sp.]|jgi:DNA-binding NtrC family response regulator|nr:sigma-54 dependent transcriptional regulator [Tannerella sp.]
MSKQEGTILVVDDNKSILAAVKILLQTLFAKVLTINNPNRIKQILSDEQVDIILLDMNFSAGINSGNEGLFWLTEIKKQNPSVPVVLFTAYADIELAVRGIKEGASDFVVKPWDNNKLSETLQTAYRSAKEKNKPGKSPQISTQTGGGNIFWGKSEVMQKIRTLVEKVAVTDANILITGENGTGKEVIACEIHRLSMRNKYPMISVDMGAITDTLFESELFGHTKGSFTDAKTDRIGKFEAAGNGTIFLDEIGNLPYHLQAKLLTVLQQRSIIRVGSNTPIPVNVRILSATNRNLEDMVKKGEFREDLMYRINTIRIHIPALRERPDDIVPLAEIFLEKQSRIYGKPELRLTAPVKEKLKTHPWYGNIRELEHFIEKAVIFSEKDTIDVDGPNVPAPASNITEIEGSTIEDMERKMIRNAINKHNGNLSLVANELGISRQTLYNKIKRYEL